METVIHVKVEEYEASWKRKENINKIPEYFPRLRLSQYGHPAEKLMCCHAVKKHEFLVLL